MMIKMRTLVLVAVSAILTLSSVSCGKSKNDKEEVSIDGCWELYTVETRTTHVGTVSVDVYIQFEQGAFVLYQRIGEGSYTRFEGSYTLGKNQELSGSYTGGKAWGPYTAAISETDLVLTKGSEADTYKRITSIPETVLSNLY